MPGCTGIQISDSAIRAVELRGSMKNPRVARFAEMSISEVEGQEIPLGLSVRELLQGHRISRDPAVLALPSLAFKIRSLSVPFQNLDQIRKVIRTVMEEHLHGFPVEDALVVFHKQRDLEGVSSRVLTLVAEKGTIGGVLEDLQKKGIDPQSVETDLSALYNFGHFAGVFPEEGTVIVIDLEAERTGILVVRDGVLQAIRAFRMRLPVEGGSGDASGGDRDDSSGEAPGPPADGGPSLEETAAKLARELARTTLTEGVHEELEAAYVTGPLSRSEGLVEALKEKTGLPLAPLPFPKGMEDLPPWAGPCIGAALKFFGRDRLHFDFRQENLAFRRKFERVKVGVTVFSILVFLFFAVLGAHLYRLHEKQWERHRDVANKSVRLFQEALPQEGIPKGLKINKATELVLEGLEKKMEELTGRGMDKDFPQIHSALSRWRDLATRIRSAGNEIEYLTVREVQLTPKWISIKGEADSPESLDSLLNVIQTNPGFEKAAFGSPPKLNRESRYSFHIHGEIRK